MGEVSRMVMARWAVAGLAAAMVFAAGCGGSERERDRRDDDCSSCGGGSGEDGAAGTGARGGNATGGGSSGGTGGAVNSGGRSGGSGASSGAAGTGASSGSGGAGDAGEGGSPSAGSAGSAGEFPRPIELVPRPLGCTADGWCWVSPAPLGNDLHGIFARAEDDVWAVGERGTIIHFDGEAWSQASQTTNYDFGAVWASGPDDVWVGGGVRALVRFDGERWWDYSGPDIDSILAIWGSAADDVWFAGLNGGLYHFDGSAIAKVEVGIEDEWFSAVWGSAADDVWIGTQTGFLHFDGTSWSPVASPIDEGGGEIAGTGPNDVWATTGNTVLHFDGSEWTDRGAEVDRLLFVHGIWIAPDGAACTIAQLGNDDPILLCNAGGTWTHTELGIGDPDVSGLMGAETGPLWIIGIRGFLASFDGETSQLVTRDLHDQASFGNVLDLAADDIWMWGSDKLLHDAGSGFVEVPEGAESERGRLWAASPNDLWNFISDGAIDRFDRATWTVELRAGDTLLDGASAVYGTPDDLWVAGQTPARRLAGEWSYPLSSGVARDLWGFSADDIWFVGADRCIEHWFEGAWKDNLCTGGADDVNYTSVWGSAPDDVWLVGTRGELKHNDGSGWVTVELDIATAFNQIWGYARDDAWIVGEEGLVFHFDGETWSPSQSGTRRTFDDVVGGGSGAIWINGADGVLLRRTGSFRP